MDYSITSIPEILPEIESKCEEIGFAMPSDRHIGSLLKSLCLSKPGGRFLELGTGIGLSCAWMIDGMNISSLLTSIDNDSALIGIAEEFFGGVANVELICSDASNWLQENSNKKFDLIFADAWPGKYSDLSIVLEMLKPGGFYVIDDMNEQENWPEGHQENVDGLVETLTLRSDLQITKLDWSTGVIVAVKHS